jgi:hypothetical protein
MRWYAFLDSTTPYYDSNQHRTGVYHLGKHYLIWIGHKMPLSCHIGLEMSSSLNNRQFPFSIWHKMSLTCQNWQFAYLQFSHTNVFSTFLDSTAPYYDSNQHRTIMYHLEKQESTQKVPHLLQLIIHDEMIRLPGQYNTVLWFKST